MKITPYIKNAKQHTDSQLKALASVVKEVGWKLSGFSAMILRDDKVTNTLTATGDDYREYDKMKCSQDDYTLR